ncbi:MAG: curli-like amyloid fiber formation chaperone CsgH [Pseudomonadota bacterium]
MNRNILIIGAASLLAVTGIAIADTESIATDTDSGCEIAKTIKNGMIKLESRYNHDDAGSGKYKMTVRTIAGSNNVNSKQRGNFSKDAGETVLLGKTHLSARGQAYEVKLDITFNGKSHKCSKKIDAST